MATHSDILAWGISWTEEQFIIHGVTESDTTEVTWHAGTLHAHPQASLSKYHLVQFSRSLVSDSL